MLKAGSVYYSILISILIGTLLGMLLLSLTTHKLFRKANELKEELVNNCENGIIYGLANFNRLKFDRERFNFFGKKDIEVILYKEQWGYLDLLVCESISREDTLRKIAVVGNQKKAKTALYLRDLDKPLLFSGNAKIIGNCQLPKAGYKRTFISQEQKENGRLIKGTVSNSKHELPKLKKNKFSINTSYSITEYDTNIYIKKIYRSFSKKTLVLDMQEEQVLEDIDISGKVIIIAKDSLNIKRSAKLNNVIVSAPKVNVEDGFKGNLQILASESVALGKSSFLKYPSLISLRSEKNDRINSLILRENSKILGGVILSQNNERVDGRNRIIISDKAMVAGTVFCEGTLQLSGKVRGSVITSNFHLETNEMNYSNVIHHGQIDNVSLPKSFIPINLMQQDSISFGIIKWL